MKSKLLIYLISFLGITVNAQLPKINYLSIDQKKIGYYESGNSEETIILLHGWPQTSYVWRHLFPLLDKQYRVIAIDLPGLGKSEAVNDYSTEKISQIVHEFITQKKLKNVHLVGHDLGTWVALTYAIQFENHLKTLTLIDAGIPGLMDPNVFQPQNASKIWQFYFHQINELPELLVKNNIKNYFNWYFNHKSHIKHAISSKDASIYIKAYKKSEQLKAGFDYYRAYQASAEFNLSHIKKLTIPILAIGGEFALQENVGLAVKPYSENLKIISLKNSGHYVPEEQPKQLSELIINQIKNQL